MNVFEYAFTAEANWKANLAVLNGYKPEYTFYSDFSIADYYERVEKGAVLDTFNRVLNSWGTSIKAMTEVALVLNHKSWNFHGKIDTNIMQTCDENFRKNMVELYTELYYKCDEFIRKHFKDKDLDYYFEIMD